MNQPLPPIFSVLLLLGTVSSILWIFSEIGRRYAVKGTPRRYFWATVERALRFPALLSFVVSAVVEVAFYDDKFLFVVACSGVALWLVLYREKKRDGEDDDYWTDLKKRLKEGGFRTAFGGAGA